MKVKIKEVNFSHRWLRQHL